MIMKVAVLTTWLSASVALLSQTPAPIDTSTVGPAVGAAVPVFSGTDQFGTPHTLSSAYGPKGVMLVFYRSADW